MCYVMLHLVEERVIPVEWLVHQSKGRPETLSPSSHQRHNENDRNMSDRRRQGFQQPVDQPQ